MENNFTSGGISGAISDPWSEEAGKHANLYYDEIRKRHDDIVKIAKNTNFTTGQIGLIKNYLFMDVHELSNGEFRRFDPSFSIAESWQRLADDPKRIQPHDITLLNHELSEMELVKEGYSQLDAHTITSKTYNYSRECDEFYGKLQQDHARIGEHTIITGATRDDDWERF